jgi:hypothetical protein
MICSSVNLLFFMSVILLVDGLHYLYAGTAGRGPETRSFNSDRFRTFDHGKRQQPAGTQRQSKLKSRLCSLC